MNPSPNLHAVKDAFIKELGSQRNMRGSLEDKILFSEQHPEMKCTACAKFGSKCSPPQKLTSVRCVSCQHRTGTRCSILDNYRHWYARRALKLSKEQYEDLVKAFPELRVDSDFGVRFNFEAEERKFAAFPGSGAGPSSEMDATNAFEPPKVARKMSFRTPFTLAGPEEKSDVGLSFSPADFTIDSARSANFTPETPLTNQSLSGPGRSNNRHAVDESSIELSSDLDDPDYRAANATSRKNLKPALAITRERGRVPKKRRRAQSQSKLAGLKEEINSLAGKIQDATTRMDRFRARDVSEYMQMTVYHDKLSTTTDDFRQGKISKDRYLEIVDGFLVHFRGMGLKRLNNEVDFDDLAGIFTPSAQSSSKRLAQGEGNAVSSSIQPKRVRKDSELSSS